MTLSDNHKTAMYQCFVQNEVGSIQAAVTAVVQSKEGFGSNLISKLPHWYFIWWVLISMFSPAAKKL